MRNLLTPSASSVMPIVTASLDTKKAAMINTTAINPRIKKAATFLMNLLIVISSACLVVNPQRMPNIQIHIRMNIYKIVNYSVRILKLKHLHHVCIK